MLSELGNLSVLISIILSFFLIFFSLRELKLNLIKPTSKIINLSSFSKGYYIVEIKHPKGSYIDKLIIK